MLEEEISFLNTYYGYDFLVDSNKKPFYDNVQGSTLHSVKRLLKLRFRCKDNRCSAFVDEHWKQIHNNRNEEKVGKGEKS